MIREGLRLAWCDRFTIARLLLELATPRGAR